MARKSRKIETGHAKTRIAVVEVENPHYSRAHREDRTNPRMTPVTVNMMESPAAHWLYKGLIGAAEYRAATDFRAWYERAGGRGAGAIDYSVPKVDGGRIAEPIDMGRMEAAGKLRDIYHLLGRDGYELVQVMCGQCLPLSSIFPTAWQQRKGSEDCRNMLGRVSEYLGYKSRRIVAVRF